MDIRFNMVLFTVLYNSKLFDRKQLNFSWKLFDGLLNTEIKLKRMSYSDGIQLICTVCKCDNEDIEHLLVDCKHVKEVWSFVETCFMQYNHDLNTLTWFIKIIGILRSLVEEMNMILGLVRWKIWKCRCKIMYDNVPTD